MMGPQSRNSSRWVEEGGIGGIAKLDSATALFTYHLRIYMQSIPRDPSHHRDPRYLKLRQFTLQ